MAIQNTAQWWIRTDGDDLNGAGYDPSISGAGTNYCDQASPQLSRTDFATSGVGSTTLTSGGGFSSDMIGNSIRLSAGTNLTLGDYFITGYTSSTEVTLDRAPDNGGGGVSGATGRVGGAWAGFEFTCTTVSTPCPNPTVAGNTINLRGDGTSNPSTPQYTTTSTFRYFTSGNTTDGNLLMRGYNGTPYIGGWSWLWMYNTSYFNFENLKIAPLSNSYQNSFALFNNAYSTAYRCHFYSNGLAGWMARANCVECLFEYDTTTQTTSGAWVPYSFGYSLVNCVIKDFPAASSTDGAIRLNAMAHAYGNLLINSTGAGIYFTENQINYTPSAYNNTIVGCSGAGIYFNTASSHVAHPAHYNLIANCGTGIASNQTGLTESNANACRSNYFYNCATNYSGIGAGFNDVILNNDPFNDSANGDYSLKPDSAARSVDVYANIPGYSGATSNYQAIGAVKTLLPDADTRFEDVQDGDSFYPFRHLVADDFYEDPPAEGTSDDFVRSDFGDIRPYYQFEIGSAEGRDYANLSDFFAAFDNTLIDQPLSQVVVVCHNDTDQDECVIESTTGLTISAPTNVLKLTITVADDSWHKGEFGKGCVIRASGGYSTLVYLGVNLDTDFVMERLVIDGDNQFSGNASGPTLLYLRDQANGPNGHAMCRVKDLILRGTDGSYLNVRGMTGIKADRSRRTWIDNCIVFNILSTNSYNSSHFGSGIWASSYVRVSNCVVYNVDYTTSNFAVGTYGIYSLGGGLPYSGVENCISMGVSEVAFLGATLNNVITDDSTGDVQSSAAVEFVDAANGDFRLRSGSVAAGSGPQLSSRCLLRDITGKLRSTVSGVTTDAGPFNNIAGYDQEVRFPTEADTSATEENINDGTRIYPLRQFVEANFQGDSPPIHPLRST
jgi:hypothetical protein